MTSSNDHTAPTKEESAALKNPEPAEETSTKSKNPLEASGPDSKNVQGEAEAENAKETGGYGY